MKTVMGAVNEFKGEWKNAEYADIEVKFIFESSGEGSTWPKGKLVGDASNNSPHIFSEVCTREEFNGLVSQLETNFGESESYSDYKVNYEMINDDMKPVMDIDWSKAPEGATHHIRDLDDGSMTEFVKHSKTGKQGEAYYSMSDKDDGHWSMHVENDLLFNLTEKPSQPVFTQAMQDNNELPPVGSKAICEYQDGVELLIVAHDLLAEDGAFALVCDSTGYWGAEASRWKPIDTRTDKEKAIDEAMEEWAESRINMEDLLSKSYDKWVGE